MKLLLFWFNFFPQIGKLYTLQLDKVLCRLDLDSIWSSWKRSNQITRCLSWHTKYMLDWDLLSPLGRCSCVELRDLQRERIIKELTKVSCDWMCHILILATPMRYQCQIITTTIMKSLLFFLFFNFFLGITILLFIFLIYFFIIIIFFKF